MKFSKWLIWLILLLILVCLIYCFYRPRHNQVTVKNYVNWNVVLNPRVTSQQRDSIVRRIKNEINNISERDTLSGKSFIYPYLNYNNIVSQVSGQFSKKVKFRLTNATEHYCSCKDSLLFNLQADLELDSSGGSIPVTTRPKPPSTHASGDIDFLSNNDSTSKPTGESIFTGGAKLDYPAGYIINKDGFIAVIDTGIDSTMLDNNTWKVVMPFSPNGSQNVLIGMNPDNFKDNNSVRHGTSVTSIILNEFYRQSYSKMLPELMILKALDDSGKGDLFSLCCALGHAVRNHAKVINISAGYYGEENEVLNYYLHFCKMNGIPVIAAAGNYEGKRDRTVCDPAVNNGAALGDGLFFYPACVSPDTSLYSVMSVTGLRTSDSSCYYQNFSSKYVTVGVMNKINEANCCAFTLSYFRDGIGLEGSSFATPVVSGRLAHSIITGTRPGSYLELLERLHAGVPSAVNPVTKTYIVN
jgi:hypothetical protein